MQINQSRTHLPCHFLSQAFTLWATIPSLPFPIAPGPNTGQPGTVFMPQSPVKLYKASNLNLLILSHLFLSLENTIQVLAKARHPTHTLQLPLHSCSTPIHDPVASLCSHLVKTCPLLFVSTRITNYPTAVIS